MSVAGGVLAAAPAQAVVGDAVQGGKYDFTVRLTTGEHQRGCTGVALDERWVLTAASCFVDNPADGVKLAAGRPKTAAVVTMGASNEMAGEVSYLVPHKDRDLVLAEISRPSSALGIVNFATPVGIGAAPVQGETVKVLGFGRTQDEWVPEKAHRADFAVDAVGDGALSLSGKSAGASVCAGDTGGPVLREKGGKAELVGISSRSWQGGCWGVEETRTGAVSTRVDDIAGWIQQTRITRWAGHFGDHVTTADFNGDGRTDVAAVTADGSLHAYFTGVDGTLEYGRKLMHDARWKDAQRIVGGDFNGDGRADIATVVRNGSLYLYTGTDDGRLKAAGKMAGDQSWGKAKHLARFKADGSGRDGLVAVASDGGLFAHPTKADGTLTGKKRELWRDRTWGGFKHLATGDFNGDGKDDVAAVNGSGSLYLYPGNAKGTLDDRKSMSGEKTWGSMQAVLGGDFDGDGKADVLRRWGGERTAATMAARAALMAEAAAKGEPFPTEEMRRYAGNGKGAVADSGSVWPAGVPLFK